MTSEFSFGDVRQALTRRLLVSLFAGLVAAGCQRQPEPNRGVSDRPQEQEVIVSAAASLKDVMNEIGGEYQRARGTRLMLNDGPSNALARQITEGAPIDLFISANPIQMQLVDASGRIAPGTTVTMLSNQLVIVVPAESPAAIRSPADLLTPQFRRVALGDPAGVPAGVYARQYLESVGLWTRLQGKLVPAGSVRAALAAAEYGSAEAAFVYRTDAALTTRVRVAFEVPLDQGPHITYQAAVIRDGPHPELAADLLRYLQGAEARAVFERHGFIHLGQSR